MIKLLYLVVLLTIVGSTIATDPTFYVSPDPITNYVPLKCGNNLQTPCASMLDAVYSFTNQTTNNSTHFIVNLLPGTFFNSSGSYGYNQVVPLYGLNVTFQAYDPTTNGPPASPTAVTIVNSRNSIIFPIFGVVVNSRTAYNTTATFINIQFVNTFILSATSDGMMNIQFNGCSFINSARYYSSDVLYIYSTYTYRQSTLTLNNCNATSIYNANFIDAYNSNINFINSSYSGNSATMIKSTGQYSNTTIVNSVISNNYGSGIYLLNLYGPAVINNTLFYNNYAYNIIYAQGSGYTINNSNFTSNICANYGTLYLYYTNGLVTNTYFGKNAGPRGAGIYSYSSTLTVQGCVFDSNTGGSGSAIYQYYRSLNLINTKIISNYARYNATTSYSMNSLVNLYSATVSMTSSSISYNQTSVSSSFSLIACTSSIVYYNQTSISNYGKTIMSCSSCSLYHNYQGSAYDPATLYCTDQDSSSSTHNHNPKRYVDEAVRATLIAFIVFFSFLLFVGVIVILICLTKQRRQHLKITCNEKSSLISKQVVPPVTVQQYYQPQQSQPQPPQQQFYSQNPSTPNEYSPIQ